MPEGPATAGAVAGGVSREEFNTLAAWPLPGGGAPGIPEPLSGPLPGGGVHGVSEPAGSSRKLTHFAETFAGPLLDRTHFPEPLAGPQVDSTRSHQPSAGPLPKLGSSTNAGRAGSQREPLGLLLEPLALPSPPRAAPGTLRATIPSFWSFGSET